jgi:hypothetical protein
VIKIVSMEMIDFANTIKPTTPQKEISEFVESRVLSKADLEKMTQVAFGKVFKNANPEEKAALGKSAFAGSPPSVPQEFKQPLQATPLPPVPDQVGGFKQDSVAPNQNKALALSDGMSKQILSLTKGWGYGDDLDNKTVYLKSKGAVSNTQASVTSNVTADKPAAAVSKPKSLIGSMEVAGAALLQTVNSDNPNSVVRAQRRRCLRKG